jgi:hypothetical protein
MAPPVAAPPAYHATSPTKTYGATPDAAATSPLLGGEAGPSSARNAWMDQPEDGDLPEDFKIGVAVVECDVEIRMGFVRKVYSILFVQLLLTAIISLALQHPSAVEFTRSHSWTLWVPMIASFVTLFGTWWKRHEHPANFILLGLFTACESILIGTVTSYYESRIVCQALLITVGVFVGLTLFTMQSKYDFSSLGPLLFAGIMGLIFAGFVQIFFPFSKTVDLVYAGFGVLLFSGYTIYDTHAIMKRLSPDEYIMGAMSLYLDFINLFLYILRVLNNSENR